VRAAVLTGVGGPEQLVVDEVPDPEIAEGQAIVDVRAAGINFADVLVRIGQYPQMPELPTILGSEVAGELDGARVMGFGESGGYAERVAVDHWSTDLSSLLRPWPAVIVREMLVRVCFRKERGIPCR